VHIGYACLTIGVPHTRQKSCTLKNADEANLTAIIEHNLKALENIIDYNISQNIRLFRISSDLIPFGSSPVNRLDWWQLFDGRFKTIGRKIKAGGLRVSMHPGQYTVLNSSDADVVTRAVQDLNYHARVLNSLGVNAEHKIVLHIGGVYRDKEHAIRRFVDQYRQLEDAVKERLVIENDDKAYSIAEVLAIGTQLQIPVVFDNLHHALNPGDQPENDLFWIQACGSTWQTKDGVQKIHYSQQDPLKRSGSHSSSIRLDEFLSFYESLGSHDSDIMLEVKDKNLSAVKCLNCTTSTTVKLKIKALEVEWSRYKYNVLENDQKAYLEIRRLLNNRESFTPLAFYHILEEALQNEPSIGNANNAALHVWGYFKDSATDQEKARFFQYLEDFNQGQAALRRVKRYLYKLAVKYQRDYLLASYYFVL